MENDNKRLWIKCEDYCSAMVFEKQLPGEVPQGMEGELHVAVFHNGGKDIPMTFSTKLRWIWQIITKGDIWSDFTIIDQESAKKLKEWL